MRGATPSSTPTMRPSMQRPRDSPTRILYDWVLGPEGQKLAEMEGYVPVTEVG